MRITRKKKKKKSCQVTVIVKFIYHPRKGRQKEKEEIKCHLDQPEKELYVGMMKQRTFHSSKLASEV